MFKLFFLTSFLLSLLLPPLSAQPNRPSARLRVIIDNDLGGDPDGLFQVAHHLLSPSVEVRGVIGSHLHPWGFYGYPGNSKSACGMAHELLRAMDMEGKVPVFEGSDVALKDLVTPSPSEAANFIVKEAMREDVKTPLYVVCGASLTNIASAYLIEPRIAKRLTLLWIGGHEHEGLAVPPPNGQPLEYNLSIDLKAGQVIFNQSDIPLWQIPRDAYRQVLVSHTELQRRMNRAGKLGTFLMSRLNDLLGRAHNDLGEVYVLGDNPLVLLTALQSGWEADPSSSRYVTIPAPKINDAGLYDPNPAGRPIRVYTVLDTRLLLEDFYTKTEQTSQEVLRLAKTFKDYFLPMPVTSPLVSNVWGAPNVLPRDPRNGLEDPTMKQWCYWDGQIIKGKDGKYHMFASRWDQATGHDGWWGSVAVHAVSDKVTGPYIDKGLCWPDNQGGKGHNVTALVLPDGSYAVVVSETRPGDVFVSKSLDGPWKYHGTIQIAPNEFSALGAMSNASVMVRPDGGFEIVPRSGAVLISKTGILGPYTVQGPSIYKDLPSLPQHDVQNLEDPVIFYTGGLYHIVVNNWSDRKAYHLTSKDGIHDWKYRGIAYAPDLDLIRYANGTVNHWDKMERPSVLIENGHVTAVTLAVLDVPKDQEKGDDNHGSKVIVVPFDGVALDRGLQTNSTDGGVR